MGSPEKASVNLVQVFRPYGATADKNTGVQEAQRLRAAVKDCTGINSALETFNGWKAQKLGDMNLSRAPAVIVSKVRDVPAGGSSEPLITDKGTAVLFVCSRNDSGDIDRDTIMHSIGSEKLELQARRLLRDLRRSAYLDIRLGKNT
jgi:peptidyl-prolyl cis-trans isomerase SurA